MQQRPWNLVADIGGTNARFGIADFNRSTLEYIHHYSVSEYRDFSAVLRQVLNEMAGLRDWQDRPRFACLALACAVSGDVVRFTNSPWQIDRREVSAILDHAPVDLINDFAAVGHGVTDLAPEEWCQLGGGEAVSGSPVAILGPGTGLGICTLVPFGTTYQVLEGEGGHVDFAPVDEREIAVLQLLQARFGRVSAERLLSGNGIVNIYKALAVILDLKALFENPADISDAALAGSDNLSVETLALFCRVLGSVAGNLALTLGARGGVYIAGGIPPRILDFLTRSDFRKRFEGKGRFSEYLGSIPVRVVLKQDLGLYGALKKLRGNVR